MTGSVKKTVTEKKLETVTDKGEEHSAYYMCKFFGEQCDADDVTVPDADNVFKNTKWTHHEGSLNCYDEHGADGAGWEAHLSGIDLTACKVACSEEASCNATAPYP